MIVRFIISLSKGRLLGHPVHTMFIHFPAALFFFSALTDFISFYYKDSPYEFSSFLSGIAGAALGWIAAIFGIIDLLKISPQSKAFNIALIHGGLNLVWLSLFSVLVGLQLKFYPVIGLPVLSVLIIKIGIVTGMLVSNFLGGHLIYKYKVLDN
jgi:uncharacterized membrane protein